MNAEEAWLLHEKYNDIRSEAFLADVSLLRNGEPLAYIIGSVPFLSTTIYLDSRPLIPRTETEYWVHTLIARYSAKNRTPVHILDLCAGSGCIGVALGAAFPDAQITFAEIDASHHSTIRKNVERNGIDASRVAILGGDLFQQVSGTFDLIVSNPPYIDQALGRTEKSVVDFEPHLALYGGTGGTEVLERILTEAKAYLEAEGELYIEHEPEQIQTLQTLCMSLGLSLAPDLDQYGVARYSCIRMAQ